MGIIDDMKYLLILFFLFSTHLLAKENSLASETSPYLLQHKSNPVDWMPWSDATFAKAKREHKPIFLSIGYSTCHWCHVMEKESFTDKKIAKLLNKYFISIKVDREEMPQVDAYYQDIYKQVHGRVGGWPLNVFMSEDKKTFFIASYLPAKRQSYSEGLETLVPTLAQKYAEGSIRLEIKKAPVLDLNTTLSVDTLKSSLLNQYDDIYEGFGSSKKFAEVQKLLLMMDIGELTQDKELLKNSYATLDAMALRGLYDSIDGGFFRYAIDASWEIPHFEKMLYNQAELVLLYTRAYEQTKKPLYKKIVTETIAMVNRRFENENLFYSASDADSQDEEGYYFTYSPQEIEKTLQKVDKDGELREALDFDGEGNFFPEGNERVHLSFSGTTRVKNFVDFKKALVKIRAKKEYPFIDAKINTAWNSMMIEALYKASYIDEKYKKMADTHLKALTTKMFDRGELYHQTILGVKPKQFGLLEDYSFLIAALIAGYESDYESEKLDFALYLLSKAKEHFYKDGVWYLSDDALKPRAEGSDKYYSSPRAKMLQNIVKLALLKENFEYEKLATDSLKDVSIELKNLQSDMPATARAYLMHKRGFFVIKADRKKLEKHKAKIKSSEYPYVLTKVMDIEDYLLCSMRHCFIKDENLEKILQFMTKGTLKLSHQQK
jgi:hypothetical protein